MKFHEKLNDWIIPSLLAFAVYYLQTMSSEMSKMSNALSVALYQVSDHENRLKSLEGDRLNGRHGKTEE